MSFVIDNSVVERCDAGEFSDFTFARTLIEMLWIALFTHRDGRAHIDFLEMFLTDDVACHRTVCLAN
jgi:DNA-binding GntR family transcriptional regulator